jgi:hypothetical protein
VTSGNRIGRRGNEIEGEGDGGDRSGPGEGKEFERGKAKGERRKAKLFSSIRGSGASILWGKEHVIKELSLLLFILELIHVGVTRRLSKFCLECFLDSQY